MQPSILRHRTGSTYLVVLFTALIVSVIGFGAFHNQAVQNRASDLERNWHEAGILATSAIEHALNSISRNANWRTQFQTHQNGQYTNPSQLGQGSIQWLLKDIHDGDILNGLSDPVRIFGRGRVGSSERFHSVLAWPHGQTLDALRTAIHADAKLTIQGRVAIRNGPISSNQNIVVSDARVLGNVESKTIDFAENIEGTVVTGEQNKTMPHDVLFSVYKQLSSHIAAGNSSDVILQNQLITPLHSPFGNNPTNPNGVYCLTVLPGGVLTIQDCRIHGTLLVEIGSSAKLLVGNNVVWNPARPDFPTLIAYAADSNGGDVEIHCEGVLNEALIGVNFNPSEQPYFGDSDTDMSDSYPASIRGLIHVIRESDFSGATTTIDAPQKITGCIVADGNVVVRDNSQIVADPSLASNPPIGYTTSINGESRLINGSMEKGLTGWSPLGSGTTISPSADFHSGASSIVVHRSSAAQGIYQDISLRAISGTLLNSKLWMRMDKRSEEVRIGLWVHSSEDGEQRFESTVNVGSGWTHVETSEQLTWNGTLYFARWYVATTSTTQSFWIDDCTLSDPSDTPVLHLKGVDGTWRAESAPEEVESEPVF